MFNSRTIRDTHLRNACRAAADRLRKQNGTPDRPLSHDKAAIRRLAHEVAQMPAPRFYVDQNYAYNVISAYSSGSPLPARGLNRRKWEEIAAHVTRRRSRHPGEPLIDSVAEVLSSTPASNFFLSENTIRKFINRLPAL